MLTPPTELVIATLRADNERLRGQLATCQSTRKRLEERNVALLRELAELRQERVR